MLIAAGKTNRRIASELFAGVGTVKTHINNAYRKLDAHSRTQALARAGELKPL
jgi:LuxR family maltose regulon positive regulatory protein